MPSKKSKKVKRKIAVVDKNIFPYLSIIGGILIVVALFIPLNTFSPVLKAEVSYQLNKNKTHEIVPVNTDFAIVIPKISANTNVIKNIDPFDSRSYQKALTQGVAHASNSVTPDSNGNVFIFAHSAGNWYQANQYNAVFYLLNKLVKGDQIITYYQNKKYTYLVKEIKFVAPTDVNYLSSNSTQRQITLMTCWPPGTTLKRLIVIADLQNVD